MEPVAEARATMSRVDAKAAGLATYFTGEACIAGHLSDRNTATGICIACKRAYSAAYHAKRRRENPDAVREATNATVKLHYERHKDKILAKKRAYYAANAEAIRGRTQAYRDKQKAKRTIQSEATP